MKIFFHKMFNVFNELYNYYIYYINKQKKYILKNTIYNDYKNIISKKRT